MYNSSVPFTEAELAIIQTSNCDIAILRDFYSRFPDQDLETAIGGCLQEIKMKAEGLTPGLGADASVNPDVSTPPESGPEAPVVGGEPAAPAAM
jgi:hypothetical protein